MATTTYNMTVGGNLSFLSGSLRLDPVTGIVASLVPTNTAFTGTVSNAGNSGNWQFNLNNNPNNYLFHNNGADTSQANGTVSGNPNPNNPVKRGNEQDNWTAQVVTIPLAVKQPAKKTPKRKAKATV